MSRFKPADRARADAGENGSVLMRGHQELVNSHLPPHPHHLQGVAAANINNIRAQNFGPDPPAWNLPVHQKEQIDLTFEEVTEILLHSSAVSL